VCAGGCATDGDCASGNYCAGGSCKPKKANGVTCALTNECTSGFCVDGVCCNAGCTGQCQSCATGTCSAVTGAPVGGRASCVTDGSSCSGACNGVDGLGCTYPAGTTSCRAASCSAGIATSPASCDGSGKCPTLATTTCAPYKCAGTACATTCAADSECTTGTFCGGGECIGKLGNGSPCISGTQCGAGNCIDGVCCDTSCSGQCEACNLPSKAGTCSAVTGAPVGTRADCASDGSLCGGLCDGTVRTSCKYPAAETVCRAGTCTSGVATLEAKCSGTGNCPAKKTQDCTPFSCGAKACLGDCATDTDCTTTTFCSGGVCKPKLANGSTCSATSQCSSGFCVDGLCCDKGCTGQCEGCDLKGKEGTCTTNTGDPRPGRPACEGTGACKGSCDGVDATKCKPGTSTAESCNGVDDNCNGSTDEGDLCPGGGTCVSGACSGGSDAGDAGADGGDADPDATDGATDADPDAADATADGATDAADAGDDGSVVTDSAADDADASPELPFQEGGGCGCRTTYAPTTAAPFALLALGAALARRRRR